MSAQFQNVLWFQPRWRTSMDKHFDSDPIDVDDLLHGESTPIIVIPPFQRAYSWEKNHVTRFWDDIINFIDDRDNGRAQKYFLGPIVTLDGKEERQLLDGQQRIATLTIIFAALRNAAWKLKTSEFKKLASGLQDSFIEQKDAGDFKNFRLTMSNLDKGFFREAIQDFSMDDSTRTQAKATIKSHTLISRALQAISDKIDTAMAGMTEMEKKGWIKEIRNTVRTDLIFTSILVTNEREAYQIFETLNDRGLRLTVPDLLLNYLMKESAEQYRDEVRRCWDVMAATMKKRSSSQFLRHVWISSFGDLKKEDLFTALKRHIKTEGKESKDFAKKCEEDCKAWCALWDGDEAVLGKKAAPKIRALVRALDCKASLPLLLSANACFSAEGLLKVTQWILVFVVRHSIIARKESSDLETLLFRLAKDTRDLMTGEEKVDPKAEKACLASLKEEFLKKDIDDKILLEDAHKVTLDSTAASYILGKLAERRHTATKEWKLSDANVEHIFPQNPSNEWKKSEIEEMEPFVDSIGNLTVLSPPLNSKLANKGYDFKRERYGKSTEIELTQEIANKYKGWSKRAIDWRAKEIGKEMVEVWSFDNAANT